MGRTVEVETETALYLGKRKLVLLEGAIQGEEIRVLRYHKMPFPRGFQQGMVQSLGDAVQSLQGLIQALGVREKDQVVTAWVGLGQTRQQWAAFESSIYYGTESRTVQPYEIQKVIQQTKSVATLPLDQQILQTLPESYLVDDVAGVKNPQGLEAKRLGVKLKLFTMPYGEFRNLNRVLEACDLSPEAFVPKALALSEALLCEEEKQQGSLLCDLSTDHTLLVFWKDGQLKDMREIAVGTDAVAQEIAQALHLDFQDAEKLKENYGTLAKGAEAREELIPIVEREGRTLKQIRRQEFDELLAGMMARWLDALMGEAKAFLKACGASHPHYILTGGGAAMDGLIEKLIKDYAIAVRLGLVHKMEAPQELLIDPSLTSAVGLFRWVLAQTHQEKILARPANALAGSLQRVRDWFSSYF